MRFRLKAFSVHLLLSACVALCSLYLVFMIWHPSPLQKAVGVTHIFLILLGVDVVIGPLFTLLVASSKEKKTLKFDLTVIVLLQISAYLYGTHSIVVSRPVYLAFDKVRVDLVQADSVFRDPAKTVSPEYQKNPWFKPEWVAIRPYKDANEQSRRTFMELQDGISPAMQADLYEPLESAWSEINTAKHHLEELKKYNIPERVDTILSQYPQADSYLPLKGSVNDETVLLDSKTKTIIAVVDLQPWS